MDIADRAQATTDTLLRIALENMPRSIVRHNDTCEMCGYAVEKARLALKLERCMECQLEFEVRQTAVTRR